MIAAVARDLTAAVMPRSAASHPTEFSSRTVRDLSLGGCHVDTTLPIDCGVRAEIVVCVNAASFRAVGEVQSDSGRVLAPA